MGWIEKFQEWNRHRKYGLNVFWKAVSETRVQILKGKYAGTIVEFSDIKMVGENFATFDYSIVTINSKITKKNELKFERIVSNIYMVMLDLAVKNYKDAANRAAMRKESDDIEENGTDYFEEPFEKRIVYKKSSSAPEE